MKKFNFCVLWFAFVFVFFSCNGLQTIDSNEGSTDSQKINLIASNAELLIKQNEILSNHEDLDKDEILNKDNYDLNIKTVKKLISLIGGTLSIESLNSNGTTINVTLDQKMVKSDLGIIENEIKKYDNFINSKKRVAVIS